MAFFRLAIPAKILLFGAYWVLRRCPAVGSALKTFHLIDIATDLTHMGVRLESDAPVDLQATNRFLTRVWESTCQTSDVEPMGLKVRHAADFPWEYGWGGSSALMLSLLWTARMLKAGENEPMPAAGCLWQDYAMLKPSLQISGSGLDVYTQLHGGAWVSYRRDQNFQEGNESEIEEVWQKFCDDHPLYFVPTFKKASSQQAVTHFEAQTQEESALNQATEHVLAIRHTVQKNNFAAFRSALRALTALTFDYAESSAAYLDFFHRLQLHVGKSGVVTSCGALGGDGVLIFFENRDHDKVHLLRRKGLTLIPLSLGGAGLCARSER